MFQDMLDDLCQFECIPGSVVLFTHWLSCVLWLPWFLMSLCYWVMSCSRLIYLMHETSRALSVWRKYRIMGTSWMPFHGVLNSEDRVFQQLKSHLCCAACFHELQDNFAADIMWTCWLSVYLLPLLWSMCIKSEVVYWRINQHSTVLTVKRHSISCFFPVAR